MKFKKNLAEALRCWPREIDISDGELREGGGGYFPSLSRAWRNAEIHSGQLSEFHKVMVWTIFCGLHREAVAGIGSGGKLICKEHIDLLYVEKKFSDTVLNGGRYYKQVRKLYFNDLLSRRKLLGCSMPKLFSSIPTH